MTFPSRLLLTLLAGAALASPVLAQPQRTFVSSSGSDANAPCPRLAPCRNFQTAVNAVAAGGEVVALDSAGYGPFTVDKSITVTSEGVHAAIAAAATFSGITVNAGPTDTVSLRNLRIVGTGGDKGIHVTMAGVVHLENVVVGGFLEEAVRFDSVGQAHVSDSIARDSAAGIFSTAARLSVERTRLENNGAGLQVRGGTAVAHDTVAAGNAGAGFLVDSSSGLVTLTIDECSSSSNGTGVANAATGGTATLAVASSTIVANAVGIDTTGGNVLTFQNNRLDENATPGAFSVATPQQ
jgi:hypothetical protein